MADIRVIKRRIRGIKSTSKITRAMEMIATSKMRRTQERGLAGRPYAEKIHQVIADLAALPEAGVRLHPLLQRRPVNKIAIVHITPDRGLCGGLNASINRKSASFILEQTSPVSIIIVGRKGLDFMRRRHTDIIAEFTQLGDKPDLIDTMPISRIIIDDYTDGVIDMVYLVYFLLNRQLYPVHRMLTIYMSQAQIKCWENSYPDLLRCRYIMPFWRLSPVSNRREW